MHVPSNTTFSSPFPISPIAIDDAFLQLSRKDDLFQEEGNILGEENPYLLIALVHITMLFEKSRGEMSCIQGALLMHYILRKSAKEKAGYVPCITEDHLLSLIYTMDTEDESLASYIEKKIVHLSQSGQGDVLAILQRAQQLLAFDTADLVAFSVGLLTVHDVIFIASR